MFFLCSFHPEYVLAFAGSPWNPLSWRWFTWLSIVCCFCHQNYHHCHHRHHDYIHCHHSHQDQHFQKPNLHLALCSPGFPWNARWLVVVHFVGQLQDKSLTLEQALYPLHRNLTSSMFVAHLYISGRLGLASQWKTGKPPDKDPLVAKRPFLDDIFVWNHKKAGISEKIRCYDVFSTSSHQVFLSNFTFFTLFNSCLSIFFISFCVAEITKQMVVLQKIIVDSLYRFKPNIGK